MGVFDILNDTASKASKTANSAKVANNARNQVQTSDPKGPGVKEWLNSTSTYSDREDQAKQNRRDAAKINAATTKANINRMRDWQANLGNKDRVNFDDDYMNTVSSSLSANAVAGGRAPSLYGFDYVLDPNKATDEFNYDTIAKISPEAHSDEAIVKEVEDYWKANGKASDNYVQDFRINGSLNDYKNVYGNLKADDSVAYHDYVAKNLLNDESNWIDRSGYSNDNVSDDDMRATLDYAGRTGDYFNASGIAEANKRGRLTGNDDADKLLGIVGRPVSTLTGGIEADLRDWENTEFFDKLFNNNESLNDITRVMDDPEIMRNWLTGNAEYGGENAQYLAAPFMVNPYGPEGSTLSLLDMQVPKGLERFGLSGDKTVYDLSDASKEDMAGLLGLWGAQAAMANENYGGALNNQLSPIAQKTINEYLEGLGNNGSMKYGDYSDTPSKPKTAPSESNLYGLNNIEDYDSADMLNWLGANEMRGGAYRYGK